MADHIAPEADITPAAVQTVAQRYAPALLSLAVLLLGGYQALAAAGYGLADVLQFVVLGATTITTFAVPLLAARYAGWLKVGLEGVGVLATALIPFVVDGHIDRTQIIVVVIAVIKAFATHWGVTIRTDPKVATTTTGPASGAVVYNVTDVPQIHDGSDLAPADAPSGPNG